MGVAECYTQIFEAYKRMVVAGYRPSAPSDGFGHIIADMNIEDEAFKYAESWWEDEERLEFLIGCCSYRSRQATIFTIEAARLMCGAFDGVALKLLEMATAELRKVGKFEKNTSGRTGRSPRNGVTDSVRYRVMRRDNFHCVLCGATGKTDRLVVDHIVPISKGGSSEMTNLRTACDACNQGKGDKLP